MLEQCKVLIVCGIQTFLFHEFPEPLNQIEIGRVGRKKEEFDIQIPGFLHHQATVLVASIIHHECDWSLQAQQGDLLQERAHAERIDVALIGHGDKLMGDGIQGSQHVEPLSPTGGPHHHTHNTPQPAQIGCQDKMGRIDEKDCPPPRFGLL